MSGVTDFPFRRLASRLGAGWVVSEMIASEALVRERKDVVQKARGDTLSPFIIQLAGCEPRWIAEGARVAADLGADLIDLNMGCPAKLVTGKQAGSALMRNLDHALRLIEAAVAAVEVPITLKMRLGWDAASMNAAELARRAEEAGIRLITVHGRTRCQFFKGSADWKAIRAIKRAVSIPVIANGDARTLQHVHDMLDASGADGAMIGRGAYGAPWLPGRIARALAENRDPGDPDAGTRKAILLEQYEDMLAHYGPELGLRVARKHLGWTAVREIGENETGRKWRRRLCEEDEPYRVRATVHALYQHVSEIAA